MLPYLIGSANLVIGAANRRIELIFIKYRCFSSFYTVVGRLFAIFY